MTSRGCILSRSAAQDLDELLTFVLERDGEMRAARVANRLYESMRRLAASPGLGHRRDDLTSRPVLFYTVWSYFVIYQVDAESLRIVRIAHAHRDIQELLRDDQGLRAD